MKNLTLFLVFLFTFTFGYSQKEEILQLPIDSSFAEGTLIIADTIHPSPVALIIAGSGPTDRNGNNPQMTNNSLKMLAELLAEHGISSLRFDKRGVAGSAGIKVKEKDLRFDHFVVDAQNWMALLKKDDRFNAHIIMGHSEGSLIGMLTASAEKVNAYVSIAGAGVSADEILKEQFESQPPMLKEVALPVLERIAKGEMVEEVHPVLMMIFRPSVQPYIYSWIKHNPQAALAALNIPILIIQGTTDIQVGVDQAEKLAKANPKATMQIIEGMNHILKDAPSDRTENIKTYSDPELPLSEGFKSAMIEFLLEALKKK